MFFSGKSRIIAGEKGQKNSITGKEVKNKFWANIKEGYEYIFSRDHLQALVYIFIALNFFFNFSIIVPLPYLLNTIWKIDSSIYGIIQGAFPVGMIIGALLVQKIMKKINYSKLLKRISYATGTGILAFALPLLILPGVPDQIFILIYYTILMLMSGFVVSWVDVPANVLLQKIVPGNILGRVISVKFSIIKIIVPVSLLLSGYFVNLVSPFYLFLTGSAVFLLFNIRFYSSPMGIRFINISDEKMSEVNI